MLIDIAGRDYREEEKVKTSAILFPVLLFESVILIRARAWSWRVGSGDN